jgi:arsenate reductase
MTRKRRILVLCTGNSCRSQMAEAWINRELGESWEARSAGTRPAREVHPLAVRAMGEVGVDLAGATPEPVDRYLGEAWDLVVTVCDSAREACPVFPGETETVHVSFPDPAEAVGSDDEKMVVFRRVRDAIRARLLPELRQRTGRGR